MFLTNVPDFSLKVKILQISKGLHIYNMVNFIKYLMTCKTPCQLRSNSQGIYTKYYRLVIKILRTSI